MKAWFVGQKLFKKADNQALVKEEESKVSKRIARDLHDVICY